MSSVLSPRHLQLREMLFKRWKTNGVKSGEKIESQNEIIRFCGFSLITVIKTLKDLEAEGVIRRQVGKGSFLVKTPWSEAHRRIGFFYNRDIVGGGIFNNEFYTKLVVAFEKGIVSDGHEFILGSFTNERMPIAMWDALDGVVLTGITNQTNLGRLSETSSQVSLIVDMPVDALPLHGFRLGFRSSFETMFKHFSGEKRCYLYLDTSLTSPEQAARRRAIEDAHQVHGAGAELKIISVNQETGVENTAELEAALTEFKPDLVCGYMHRPWQELIHSVLRGNVVVYAFTLDAGQAGFVVDTDAWMGEVLPRIYTNLENRQLAPRQHTFAAKFNP